MPAEIYNNWEKQKKSAILSDMIVRKDSIYKHNEALIKQKSNLQRLMSNAMVQIYLNDPKHPLVKELNECLEDTHTRRQKPIHINFGEDQIEQKIYAKGNRIKLSFLLTTRLIYYVMRIIICRSKIFGIFIV